jgi:hypothetical protein
MREWIHQVGRGWSGYKTQVPKQEHVQTILNRELSDYILCFFFTAYLRYQQGDMEASRRVLSQIWFLERNPQALSSWIGSLPVVAEDPSMMEFLQTVKDPAVFHDPIPWRRDDFGVGRFLLRLLFHRDIRSNWELGYGTLI